MPSTLSVAIKEPLSSQDISNRQTQSLGSRHYEEKRDFIRMRVNTDALIIDDKGNETEAYCHNLSGGGALLEVKDSFPVNHRIQVIIQSQHGHAPVFSSEGSVVRSQKKGSDEHYLIGVRY